MAYPDTATLIGASSGEAREALDALSVTQQDELRSSAIAAIEGWCHQAFTVEGTEAEPVERALDGTGGSRLYLPRRLAQLTALSVNGHTYQLTDAIRDPDGKYLGWVDPLVGGSWVNRVRRHPSDPGPLWPLGQGNVLVAGVWGWTDEEWAAGDLDAVASAVRFDMEDQALADASKLAATVRSARALGLSSVSQGGLSAQIKAGEPGLSVRAQRKLRDLRWDAPIAAVA